MRPATSVNFVEIGSWQFELQIRHQGPLEENARIGYSVFYDIGTFPSHGPIITAQLGTGIQLTGIGQLAIVIPVISMQRLHLGTYLASLDMTDSVNTRQIFVGQLPIIFGGVSRLSNQSATTPVPNAAGPPALPSNAYTTESGVIFTTE